jgi:hypothetical protein
MVDLRFFRASAVDLRASFRSLDGLESMSFGTEAFRPLFLALSCLSLSNRSLMRFIRSFALGPSRYKEYLCLEEQIIVSAQAVQITSPGHRCTEQSWSTP